MSLEKFENNRKENSGEDKKTPENFETPKTLEDFPEYAENAQESDSVHGSVIESNINNSEESIREQANKETVDVLNMELQVPELQELHRLMHGAGQMDLGELMTKNEFLAQMEDAGLINRHSDTDVLDRITSIFNNKKAEPLCRYISVARQELIKHREKLRNSSPEYQKEYNEMDDVARSQFTTVRSTGGSDRSRYSFDARIAVNKAELIQKMEEMESSIPALDEANHILKALYKNMPTGQVEYRKDAFRQDLIERGIMDPEGYVSKLLKNDRKSTNLFAKLFMGSVSDARETAAHHGESIVRYANEMRTVLKEQNREYAELNYELHNDLLHKVDLAKYHAISDRKKKESEVDKKMLVAEAKSRGNKAA